MAETLNGVFTLLQIAGVIAAIALLVFLVWRPTWLHVDYDALLWRSAITDTKAFVLGQSRTEVFILLGTFIGAFVFQGATSTFERFMNGLSASLGALVIGAPVLFVWSYVNASWKVFQNAKNAPYEDTVTFWTDERLDTVVLRVRHRIKTGAFSAQVWLMNGGVPLSTPSTSLAWSDTSEPLRVIVAGESQYLNLMRFEVSHGGEDEQVVVHGFLCGAGGIEHPIRLIGEHIGKHDFRAYPIELHINVTDSDGTPRKVLVWIAVKASRAQYATISSHLVREW